MVLDRYRLAADRFLVPVASRMLHVNPNAVSWTAFLASVGAGISFFLGGGWFLGLALFLLLVNSYLDALDGKIARLAGRASARGDFLDHCRTARAQLGELRLECLEAHRGHRDLRAKVLGRRHRSIVS